MTKAYPGTLLRPHYLPVQYPVAVVADPPARGVTPVRFDGSEGHGLAADQHPFDPIRISQQGDIRGWVSVEDQQVGEPARCDCPGLAVEPKGPRAGTGSSLNGFQGREVQVVDEYLQFPVMPLAVRSEGESAFRIAEQRHALPIGALVDVYRNSETELLLVDCKLSNSELFDLPAGPAAVLAGEGYREESFVDDRDPRLDGTIVFTDYQSDTFPLARISHQAAY